MAQKSTKGPQIGSENPEGDESGGKLEDAQKKSSKQGPRKRVSQACDKCRSRKDKCDGKKPVGLL
jgi:hypothetical protein